MRTRLLSLLSALSIVGASVAEAAEGDWAPAFEGALAAGRFAEEGLAVMVVAAGAPHPELEAARRALAKALTAAGRAEAVLDEAALGSLLGLDDAALLERLRAFPVERVLIVRVYPGPAGRPPSALVTVYGPERELLEAVRVKAGALLAEPDLRDPVAAFDVDLPRRVTERSRREAEPERELSDDELVALYPEWITFGDLDPYRYPIPLIGSERRKLEGAALYEHFGRKDLAQRYRTTDALRSSARTVGVIAAATGALLLVGSYVSVFAGSAFFVSGGNLGTFASVLGLAALTGLILLPTGALVGGVAGFMNPHPLKREEIRALVDEHNEKLRADGSAPPVEADRVVEPLDVDVE